MKRTATVVSLILAAGGAWAQVSLPANFDGGIPSFSPQIRFKKATLTHSISPEAKLAQSAKAAVVNVLVVIKWADVPDANLPRDPEKIPPALAAQLAQSDSPEGMLQAYEATHGKLPRISRDKLPLYETAALGSGFIVRTPNGGVIVVTNHHVVETADIEKHMGAKPELHIKLSNDQFARHAYTGDIVAQVGAVGKRGMDVAFLKIPPQQADGSAWPALVLGDSSQVQEGEDVWAMGFPEGLNYTMTKGIVSAVHVTFENNPYVSYIQTDAPINPGNSGGPLVRVDGSGANMRVEVIGMDTQILSEGGGSNGLGFAIESNSIKRALDQYLRTGSIDVGYVGIGFMRGTGANREKIVVKSVVAGGPADKAGLKAGDVIESVGGKAVSANPEVALFQIAQGIKAKDPGESVSVTVTRGGQAVSTTIVVEKEPQVIPKP